MFQRDDMEPVAHVVQAFSGTVSSENRRHLYEDTVLILDTLLAHALAATESPAERYRFKVLRGSLGYDKKLCGLK